MLTPSPTGLIALCGLALSTTALGQWNANYAIQRAGLVGPEHTGNAGLQSSTVWSVLPSGFVVGGSNRYLGGSTFRLYFNQWHRSSARNL